MPGPVPDPSEEPIRACLKPNCARRFALCVLTIGATAPRAAAQSTPEHAPPVCPDGRITHVFVDNHSIYDVDQVDGAGALGWLYSAANALHIKTRESFIRRELLFDVGDCFDPFLIEESGRILRRYNFLARADVYPVEVAGGDKHVVVDTQDEWTTRVDLGVSFDSHVQFEALEVSEENLAGQGIQASVFFRQRKERKDLGGRLNLPRLFGSRTDGFVSAGRTRRGTFMQERVAYPFVGEVGRFAVRQAYSRRDELFPYVVADAASDFSHVLLPNFDERAEVSVAGRLGRPGNLTLLGIGVSRETLDFEAFPANVEVARENDFANTAPAPSSAAERVRGQAHPLSTTRLDFFVGQRNLRFARIRGLDALTGVQDIELGTDVGLTLGRSVDVLSARGLDGADDLFARLRLYAGFDPGTSFIFMNVAAEGRDVFSGSATTDGWKDVLGEFDLFGYLRSRKLPDHTFFARASGSGGWSMTVPFQLTLGGREGLRGLQEEDFPGARRALLTLEDRLLLHWPAPEAFDFGLTAFAEAGRVWAGQVPYGVDSGWKGTVGLGLRLGFPSGTRGLARLDLAFPLGMDNTRGPVFRVTLYELLGVAGGFEGAQMLRSRRFTVGPDYFTTGRR